MTWPVLIASALRAVTDVESMTGLLDIDDSAYQVGFSCHIIYKQEARFARPPAASGSIVFHQTTTCMHAVKA